MPDETIPGDLQTTSVSRSLAQQEVGHVDDGPFFFGEKPRCPYHGLLEFEAWLYRDWLENSPDLRSWSTIRFRLAPSIITRSESELFGLSSPRFALRAVLRDGTSFVNVRRNSILANEMSDVADEQWQLAMPLPDIIGHSTCIADGLLAPSDRVLSRFNVLTVELGRAYGEERPIEGTPFVRLMPLGGGLCAQASCFMATLLCHDYVSRLVAIAEITAQARRAIAGIDFVGLSDDEMLSYFREVGLSSYAENEAAPDCGYAKWIEMPAGRRSLQAISAYVASGLPVLLFCDLGRLAGHPTSEISPDQSVYAQLPREPGISGPNGQRHCVVVVGVSNDGQPSFLLNDPATLPFLEAKFEQLFDARQYKDVEPRTGLRDRFSFISVLPRDVRLPLLTAKGVGPVDSGHVGPGLLSLSAIALSLAKNCSGVPQQLARHLESNAVPEECAFKVDHECFRLVNLSQVVPGRDARLSPGPWVPKVVHRPVLERVKEILPRHSWVWLQFSRVQHRDDCPISVRVWDAERPATRLAYPKALDYLLGTLQVDPVLCHVETVFAKPARTTVLKPALISSFATSGLKQAKDSWPKDAPAACELYVWMNPAQEGLLDGLDIPTQDRQNAVRVMAFLSQRDELVRECARRVGAEFDGATVGRIPIAAIATFIPELASERDDKRDLAQKAIVFLAKFAKELRGIRHPCHTVELVSGSRLGCLRVRRVEEKQVFHAPLSDEKEVMDRLLATLEAGLLNSCSDLEGTAFAVELEPGPLFVLRDQSSLLRFSENVSQNETCSKYVGINVDIAHFKLARIAPEWVDSQPVIRNRIVHAHCSGHHRCGHLGDIHLLELNEDREYLGWLQLLERIALDPRSDQFPKFSSYVSVEFEAARSGDRVRSSVLALADVLTRLC